MTQEERWQKRYDDKPANYDSGGCSVTWLRALIAEALPSITLQRYE
jgi:hypothetical protein